MNASRFIKRLLGQKPTIPGDVLSELAHDPKRQDEFLLALLNSQVLIMSQGKALDTDSPTQSDVLEHIKEGAKQLSSVQSADELQVYIHNLEGQPVLPFFSSSDFFTAFIQSLRLNRVTCYDGLEVSFKYLLNPQFAKNHFVLNLGSTAQRHVSVDDRKKLIMLARQGQATS